jgi:lipoprotein NlpI
MKRDWKQSPADFQRHSELRKADPYQVFSARFYIWLLQARLGNREAADQALTPLLKGHPPEWSGGWDAKTINFLLGKISEEDFLTALSDNPGAAWFYAGMKRLLNNAPEPAATAFQKSVETGKKNADECRMAAAELKALTK